MDSLLKESIYAALNALPRRVHERCLVAMTTEPNAQGAYMVMIGNVCFDVVAASSR